MKFEKIQPGMTLYDVAQRIMGNTRMTTISVYTVHIIAVNRKDRSAMVSWNGNPPALYSERSLAKLRVARPHLVERVTGGYRLETRDERAARLAKET